MLRFVGRQKLVDFYHADSFLVKFHAFPISRMLFFFCDSFPKFVHLVVVIFETVLLENVSFGVILVQFCNQIKPTKKNSSWLDFFEFCFIYGNFLFLFFPFGRIV